MIDVLKTLTYWQGATSFWLGIAILMFGWGSLHYLIKMRPRFKRGDRVLQWTDHLAYACVKLTIVPVFLAACAGPGRYW